MIVLYVLGYFNGNKQNSYAALNVNTMMYTTILLGIATIL